jgi:flagellar basal-body rod protein FlgG
MDLSFYTAAVGANSQQTRMNIIANNLANINTEGYKTQSAGFVDLLYNKYYRAATRDPETGCGARVEKTDILYEQGGIADTGGAYDFAIMGEGFFAVYDPGSDRVFYTRNGHFSLSNYSNDDNLFYLANDQGYLILDKSFGLVYVDPQSENQDLNIGVFDFVHKEGMLLMGNNVYLPVEKNGEPFLNETAQLAHRRLEMSNVDLAYEMSRVIETQRAYQMELKMIQTSDEIEQTINSLRV